MESLLNFLKQNNIEWNGKTFVLAVSTGIDSSVLLDKFIKLSKTEDIKIVVAHVNHNRRNESLVEEKYIKEYTESLGIKCYVKELYFDNIDNFQAVARELRFEFFNEVMEEVHGDYLVLAHHAIDNIETVLIRMMRGSSLAGYSGINPVYKAKGYTIIRPLINLTRSDIEEYQKENNVKYFEDSSNSHDDYFRNRLRHNVIPAMFKECPDLDKKIIEFSDTIRSASIVINNLRDDFIGTYVKKDNGIISFSKEKLLSIDPYMQMEVLFELLKPLMLSTGVVKEVRKIILNTQGSFNNLICKTLRVKVTYDEVELVLNPQEEEVNNLNDLYLVIDREKEYVINDKLKICVEKTTNNPITNLWELCYNKLPLVIRTRRDGDRIKLKPGYKKINDLFIDKKIPKSKRDEILLALDEEEVLIAFGVRKSEVVKNTIVSDGYIVRVERNEE